MPFNNTEEYFRQLIENVQEIYFLASLDWNRVYYLSAAYEDVWGRPREEVYGNAFAWAESIHPEDREAVLAKIQSRNLDDPCAPTSSEFRIVRPDGSIRWIAAQGFPILDSAGNVQRVAGVAQDITERKQADILLREKTDELDRFFRLTLDFLCIANTEGQFIRVNPTWERMLGYSVKDLEGKTFFDFVHPEDLEKTKEVISELSNGHDVINFVNRYKSKDGSYRWIQWRSAPYEGRLIYAAARDITDQVTTNDALRESEQNYKSLFENMTAGFALHELIYDENHCPIDYRYLAMNPTFERLTGLSAPNTLGRTVKEILPNTEQYWIDVYGQVAETGRATAYRNFSKALGKHFDVWAFSPQKGRCAVVCTDVTERVQGEAELRRSLGEKEVLLRELYHRTKNNMQVICSLLALQSSYSNEPQVAQVFREMENRIRSMALVHQKLYQSQDLSRINLKEYIQDLAALLLKSYRISASKVTVNLDLVNVSVMLDAAVPCGLILNELVSNSLKYAFPGDRQGVIKIALHKPSGDLIDLSVSDNGVGVPKGFDFRSEGKLGLRSVFAIAEQQLQGSIDFDLNGGVGCHVRFNDSSFKARV